jgi:hypothetical protein
MDLNRKLLDRLAALTKLSDGVFSELVSLTIDVLLGTQQVDALLSSSFSDWFIFVTCWQPQEVFQQRTPFP